MNPIPKLITVLALSTSALANAQSVDTITPTFTQSQTLAAPERLTFGSYEISPVTFSNSFFGYVEVGRLYVSKDQGKTFELSGKYTQPLSNQIIHKIKDIESINAKFLFADRLHISQDNGVTYREIPLDGRALDIELIGTDGLLIATDSGLRITYDLGQNVYPFEEEKPIYYAKNFAKVGDEVVTLHDRKVTFFREDQSRRVIDLPISDFGLPSSFVLDGDRIILASSVGVVSLKSDGTDIKRLNTAYCTDSPGIQVSDKYFVFNCGSDYSRIDKDGSNQVRIRPEGYFSFLTGFKDGTLIAVNNKELAISKDFGNTFAKTTITQAKWPDEEIEALFYDNGQYVVYSSHGIYRSADQGTTFVRTPRKPKTMNSFHQVAESNGMLIAGTDRGIFRSVDLGQTFEPVDDTQWFYSVRLMSASGSNVQAVSEKAVYFSTDQGASFQKSLVPIDVSFTSLREAVANGNFSAIRTQSLIYFSLDKGRTYKRLDAGTRTQVYDMKISGDDLYIAHSTGLSKFNLNTHNLVEYAAPFAITSVMVDDNEWLIAGDRIYRSTTQGQDFQSISNHSGMTNEIIKFDSRYYLTSYSDLSVFASE